jgi:hypothetical protein
MYRPFNGFEFFWQTFKSIDKAMGCHCVYVQKLGGTERLSFTVSENGISVAFSFWGNE